MNKNWDRYFLNICNVVATNSKCLSRQIGSALVRDKSLLCTGYNGPARGIPHCGFERYEKDLILQDLITKKINNVYPILQDLISENINNTCPRQLMGYKSGEGLDICIAAHAEGNALINAARNGVITKGCTMYMNCPTPCSPCLIEIINAGIKEIVFTKLHYYDKTAEYILINSDLIYRVYDD